MTCWGKALDTQTIIVDVVVSIPCGGRDVTMPVEMAAVIRTTSVVMQQELASSGYM